MKEIQFEAKIAKEALKRELTSMYNMIAAISNELEQDRLSAYSVDILDQGMLARDTAKATSLMATYVALTRAEKMTEEEDD